jgi:uncharacterized RDD family membrane protein YckC
MEGAASEEASDVVEEFEPGEPPTEPEPFPEGNGDRQGLFTKLARGASERVLDVVQPDMVLDLVDINALLDRVDVNAILERVDINALLDRVDVDALMARADIDAIMARVDVRAIVDRAGIPEIVAESTGHLGTSALDLFRKPLVGIDEIVFRVANGIFGRDPASFPDGPESLTAWVDAKVEERAEIVGRELAVGPGTLKTGRYGGPLTRLLAVVLDGLVVTTTFTLLIGVATYLVDLLTDRTLEIPESGLWYGIGLTVLSFFYMWLSLGIFGKTLGKMVLGLRVVGYDGSVLNGKRALVRTVTYPLSFIVFGLGLLGVVFGRERRAWHDHFAGSAVVYDWGNRSAQMPTPLADWLERRGTL